jgi:2-keto-3-deoxy-L-arabinonate dehydratase
VRELRQGGILTAKALMNAGGVIACNAPHYPFAPMHPAVHAGLPDAAWRIDPRFLH